jgi:predicted DsbA family dithiol-disulfide isomerase
MNKQPIRIDIISDVVCPWCYIGKRRLEKALEQLSDRFEFELAYHPFELNPDMPATGVNQREYLSRKFGGPDQYQQITAHTTSVAAREGLAFHFDRQLVSPNTRNAHRLIQLAGQEGKQLAVVEGLFKAYFTEGVDLSKDENLVRVAVQAGLDEEATTKFLASDEGKSAIAMAEKEVRKLGITGVPFYIINNTYGVSGAQAPETFVEAIEKVGVPVVSDGNPAMLTAAIADRFHEKGIRPNPFSIPPVDGKYFQSLVVSDGYPVSNVLLKFFKVFEKKPGK